MRIESHSVRLVHATPDPELVIEQMGRICWKSEGRVVEGSHLDFIRMLKGRDHASVLEHASAGFIITTDRGISHELVRHRLASFSQSSTRYCNFAHDKFGGEITVVKPVDLPGSGPAFEAWKASCEEAERRYMELLAAGQKPQVARAVLPTCLMTEVGMSANLREWKHVLALRTTPAAHPDMRVVAGLLKTALVRLAPTVFGD